MKNTLVYAKTHRFSKKMLKNQNVSQFCDLKNKCKMDIKPVIFSQFCKKK